MSVDAQRALGPPPVALYNRPKIRAAFYQFVLLAAVLWFGYEFALNAKANLDAQKITSGFGFLENAAGFGISQSLIPYNELDTYGRVFLVGLLNTLLVAGIGIVLATILGFLIGIARLSPNWLVARLAGGYVELIRNLPLLFQILFWYLAVLGTLPGPRQSLSLFGEIFVNNRGIIVPAPVAGEGAGWVFATFAAGVVAAIVFRLWAKRRRVRTGREFPVLWINLGLIIALPLAVLVATGGPIGFAKPELRGFNFVGGIRLLPEFVARRAADHGAVHGQRHAAGVPAAGDDVRQAAARVIGVSLFAAAYMAEVVRGGLQAIPRGQYEAARALGLGYWRMMRLIILPQALTRHSRHRQQLHRLFKDTTLVLIVGIFDLLGRCGGFADPNWATPKTAPPAMRSPRWSFGRSASACRAIRGTSRTGYVARQGATEGDRRWHDERVAIEHLGLNKWYGDFHVLRDINLEVAQGRAHRHLRAVGLRQIDADPLHQPLEEHQQGRIVVDGIELTKDVKKIDEVRREVGMVFQQFNLFPHLTVLENLHAGADLGAQACRRRRPRRSRCTTSSGSRFPSRRTNIRGSSPAVSSSASRSRARCA